jgi:membrane associated rhomboid family serine protease
VLPLSDMLRARSFPYVNVALIVANFLVFILYELPNGPSAVDRWSFYPCAVDSACHAPEPWLVSWFTAMFLHGGWDHILGNMLFLAIFGKNVEDAYGHLRYLALYVVGGFVAMMTQTLMTLVAGSTSDALVPNLGASGAIAAVLGAYLVLYPKSQILTWVVVWVVTIPAWVFLGGWFVYQLYEANAGLLSPGTSGSGVAFFAHVGGFAFGAVVTLLLQRVGWVQPQDYEAAESTGRRPARTLWSTAA